MALLLFFLAVAHQCDRVSLLLFLQKAKRKLLAVIFDQRIMLITRTGICWVICSFQGSVLATRNPMIALR